MDLQVGIWPAQRGEGHPLLHPDGTFIRATQGYVNSTQTTPTPASPTQAQDGLYLGSCCCEPKYKTLH